MGQRMKKSGSRRSWRSWLSVLLVAALVFTLLPTAGVMAAGAIIKIDNLYTSATRPTGANDEYVDRFSTSLIEVVATIEGINPDQIPNIYYEVYNVTTGVSSTNRGNPAVASNNGKTITFRNVQLTEGLNRIVIMLDGTSLIASQPGWAYFTPATRIERLQVNGEDFVDDKIYPTDLSSSNYSTLLDISGYAYNTSEVNVELYGASQSYTSAVIGNRFSVIADSESSTSNANFKLKPGDNLFTFTASNATHSYQLQKTLIYDNGNSFAYDVTLEGFKLLTAPTFEKGTSPTELDLKAKLKVDIADPDTGALRYNELMIRVDGTSMHTIDLTSLTPVSSKEDVYNLYEIDELIDVSTLSDTVRYHVVTFVFRNGTDEYAPSVNFGFYYVDPDRAYIEYVARKKGVSDTTGTRMSPSAITEIPEQPATFYVYGNDRTLGIQVYVDGDLVETVTTPEAGSPHKFSFDLDGLESGDHELSVIPLDNLSPVTPNVAGKMDYYLQVNTSPYVIFQNVYSGMVIENFETQLGMTCVDNSSCYGVGGRLVNVPQSEVGNIKVYLNGTDISSFFAADAAGKRFSIRLATSGGANSLEEGRNVLTIEIYINGQRTSISTLELYKFEFAAPQFTSVSIVEEDNANPKFTPGSVANTYFTSEDKVTLTGKFANADEISLRVLWTNDMGEPEVKYELFRDEDGDGTFTRVTSEGGSTVSTHQLFRQPLENNTFTTREIDLTTRGDTTFEFFITNDETNITVTHTITITHNAVPYTIEYPETYLNSQGLPQANINSNYSVVEIRAEYADAITVKNARVEHDKEEGLFRFEVRDLKQGQNKVEFTVVTGQEQIKGTLILYNINQPEVGAQYKAKLSNRIRAFNNQLELTFPRNTSLKRMGGDGVAEQYLSDQRYLLFGIANSLNGEVDPVRDPAYVPVLPEFSSQLNDRFQPASQLYWIDAGSISAGTEPSAAYEGSGQLPMSGSFYYKTRLLPDQVVPTQRAELTIKYNSYISDDAAWRYLTVFQYKIVDNGTTWGVGQWVNLGGVVNTKNKTITVPVDSFGYFQVMYMDQSHDDVITHNWARNELETIYAKGYMDPKSPPSLFVPNDPITRGEFITMLMKLYDYELNYKGDSTFIDVFWNNASAKANMYDYRYVETAARAGVIRGTGQRRFNPGDVLTREDAAAMIARAGNLKLESDDAKALSSLQKSFTDAAAIKYYHRASVEAVTKAGLITGKPHSVQDGEKQTYYFDPTGTLTRAEAAAIAIRILKNEKKLPN